MRDDMSEWDVVDDKIGLYVGGRRSSMDLRVFAISTSTSYTSLTQQSLTQCKYWRLCYQVRY